MKKFRLLLIILTGILLINIHISNLLLPISAATTQKQVDMLVTHDLHSHLASFEVMKNGEKQSVGGFARMKTLIDEKKAENPDTFVLDAGDFSMGTLYQVLYETEAIELIMLGKLGFDATTFGNHEFDYGSKGLANMLNAASQKGETLPAMLVCNVDWSKEQGDSEQIRNAFENYGGKNYTVIQKGDVSIAVIGVFGKDALECVPNCELTFLDPVKSVKKTVQEIQKNEQVDMIVCLSHSGTNKNESKSEDEILAKEVPALDLIISGHTHTHLKEAIVHGNTYIVSVGEYGQYIGDISMTQKEDGRWTLTNYETVKLDSSFAEDEEIKKTLEAYDNLIEENYLSQFGYEKNQVLFKNIYEFETLGQISNKHEEARLGNFMTDAYIYSVETLSDDKTPVDVAIVPAGVIRETILPGEMTVDKVFEMFSLGTGPDGVVGYPLLSAYLTGAEIKTIAEIDASISDYMTEARLYLSGVNFTYNPNRLILNRVTDIYLTGKNGERIELENDKLYHIVADLYSGQMLSAVTDISKGLLSIKPKNAQGKLIKSLEDQIIYADGKELKAWYAIAAYSESFEEENGVKVIPTYYGTTQGRKVVEDSKNLWDLIKKPNRYAVMIVSTIVIILVVVVLLTCKIWRFTRRKKK